MHSRRGRPVADADLSMTPMIDVVFLLLIFFLSTISVRDVVGQLEVARPSGSPGPPHPGFSVTVGQAGYTFEGRRVDTEQQLGTYLANVAARSTDSPILVSCSGDSSHWRLVKVLDLCANSKLRNISVLSR